MLELNRAPRVAVATPFDRNSVRPGCDVDLDVLASGKKGLLSLLRVKEPSRFEPRRFFSHPNQERRSDSKCFCLWERAREGKVVPDPEEVRTNCEWTTSDGGESFSSSLDTDGAVDDQ